MENRCKLPSDNIPSEVDLCVNGLKIELYVGII